MKFGYFDDVNREYVINTPKTPYPWINYLGNEDFFGLISNTSGGYCFYKDAKLRRITRYRYNNVPVDDGGRYFYIYDNGDVWSHTWKPVKKELSFYECRHGLGYSKFAGERNNIRVDQLSFVPLEFNGEVHQITIKNTGDNDKAVKLFSFVEFCLWNASDDSENFQRNFSTGEVEVEGSVIYHKTEYKERRNHYAFYSVNSKIDGFDTDRDSFVGLYNGFSEPQAVLNGQATNSVASGWAPIASHQINIDLKPGEEKTLIFILGYVENKQEEKLESKGVINKTKAKDMINKFKTEADVSKAFEELKSYWDKLLNNYTLKSDDEKLNRMVNIWNPYQCMITFNMSRSASYFESGIGRGMGFRDSNQDLLGFVHQIPERARQRIIDIASTQFEDGGCYHQYQPLTKKGNNDIGSGFNDDPLWLILGVTAYIKESGDEDILKEQVPFDSDVNNTATLMHHLKVSFDHVINNRGPNGLPLIGHAEWNDCLNLNCFSTTPGEPFQTTENKEGGNAEKDIDSVKEKLDTKYGIRLNWPAFTTYHVEMGEISTYPAGYKENAGIFCHNNPWIACAETVIGRGDRAFEIYKKIAPAYIEEEYNVKRNYKGCEYDVTVKNPNGVSRGVKLRKIKIIMIVTYMKLILKKKMQQKI